jgi:hypothetical protein
MSLANEERTGDVLDILLLLVIEKFNRVTSDKSDMKYDIM